MKYNSKFVFVKSFIHLAFLYLTLIHVGTFHDDIDKPTRGIGFDNNTSSNNIINTNDRGDFVAYISPFIILTTNHNVMILLSFIRFVFLCS